MKHAYTKRGLMGFGLLAVVDLPRNHRWQLLRFSTTLALGYATWRRFFDVSVINDDNIVKSEEFILAAGLDEYEMGNLKITNSGIDIEPIDDSKEITEQELAMITSYIKQQVRDTYGVQLKLKEDI